jgi:hypothetical protein
LLQAISRLSVLVVLLVGISLQVLWYIRAREQPLAVHQLFLRYRSFGAHGEEVVVQPPVGLEVLVVLLMLEVEAKAVNGFDFSGDVVIPVSWLMYGT